MGVSPGNLPERAQLLRGSLFGVLTQGAAAHHVLEPKLKQWDPGELGPLFPAPSTPALFLMSDDIKPCLALA